MSLALATALSVSLAAAPEDFSVAVTRRLGVDPAKAAALAAELATALDAGKESRLGPLVPPAAFAARAAKAKAKDPLKCAGAAKCAAEVGKAGGLSRVVSVQLAGLGGVLTLDCSLVEVGTGAVLSTATVTVPAGEKVDFATLATRLLEPLPRPKAPEPPPNPWAKPPPLAEVVPPPPPAYVPPVVAPVGVEPPPPPPPAVRPPGIEQRPAPGPGLGVGRLAAIGLGAGAVLAAGAGTVLGVMASSGNEQLRRRDPDFAQKQAGVRGLATGADVAFVAAGALAAGAVVTFFLSGPDTKPLPVSVVVGEGGGGLVVHGTF